MKKQSFIHRDSKLRLLSLKLSSNPEATVVDDPEGIDGKINQGTDGRKYYLAEFEDPENPFNPTRLRVVAQNSDSQGNGVWRVPAPKRMMTFKGKEIPAGIVTQYVEPYVVNDRTVETYTTVVFKHEIVEQVFERAGHTIVGVDSDVTITKDADLGILS
jgi:hypothetical protein